MEEFVLTTLPFALDALEPAMSRETLEYHYGKHHQTYVNNLNALIRDTEWEDRPMRDMLRQAKGAIFNNAAQVYNHNYFWKCLSPQGGGEPEGELLAAITARWGSFVAFREEFSKAAAGNFGSGWTWLVKKDDGGLDILSTSNADTPAAHGLSPMLTIDVWEHAYYIDYRNARPKYIAAFLDRLVNWEFVAARFAGASCRCGQRGPSGGACCCGCSS